MSTETSTKKDRHYYEVQQRWSSGGWQAHRGYFTEKSACAMAAALTAAPGCIRILKDGQIWAVK